MDPHFLPLPSFSEPPSHFPSLFSLLTEVSSSSSFHFVSFKILPSFLLFFPPLVSTSSFPHTLTILASPRLLLPLIVPFTRLSFFLHFPLSYPYPFIFLSSPFYCYINQLLVALLLLFTFLPLHFTRHPSLPLTSPPAMKVN